MRKVVTGEELAQIYNPDPFAMPRWRAPVYRTPFGIILVAKLFKLLAWLTRMIARHPLAASVLALAAVTWVKLGWVTLAALAWPLSSSWSAGGGAGRSRSPGGSAARPGASGGPGATGAAGLLSWPSPGSRPWYQGRTLLPVLGKVTATRYTDRVMVRLVSGQSAADFAKCAENLAHGFGAHPVPGPHGQVRARWCWSSSAGTPWPPSSPPCRSPLTRSQGAAGRPPGRRAALAGPAARDARADRGRDRGGEGLAAVGPGPGHVPADARRPGAGAGR